jgi:hypothetical protein
MTIITSAPELILINIASEKGKWDFNNNYINNKSSDVIKLNIQEQGKEQVEYWENGIFQCKIEKKMAEEILNDHKHWGNKVRIIGEKFHVEIRGKVETKGEKSKIVSDDLPAGQPTVGIGIAAGYVE